MSRLDDELRMAFRREQPPVDFTDRVLERIARQPAPKPRWWQSLAGLFQPPKLRWVAIGATAALLVAIGAAQYARLRPVVIDDNGVVATNGDKPHASESTPAPVAASSSNPAHEAPAPKLEPTPHRNHRVVAISHRTRNKTRARDRVVNPEAEAAKEKVMLALHIMSSTFNDAQRAIREDSDKPQR